VLALQKKTAALPVAKPPVVPVDDSVAITSIDLEDEADFGDFILLGANLVGSSATQVVIERAHIKQSRCNALNLIKSKLADVILQDCDLSNGQWLDCKFNRVEIIGAKLTGLHLVNGDFTDLKMSSCAGEMVQFHGSTFKRCLLQDCQLKGADFRFCNLEGAALRRCDLTGAEFYGAKLNGADLRDCDLSGLKAHPEDLKGAIIDADQAAMLGRQFALLLGIDVRDVI
jgi:uncharacterized protein YjbI with pentapeptide repeats